MGKILILISIMLLYSYSTECAKLLHDRMNDKSDMNTDTSKAGENIDPNSVKEENLMLSGTRRIEAATKLKNLCQMNDPDPNCCGEDGEPCDIHTSICIDNIHYSKESNSTFFTQHHFTLDTAWESVGTPIYCRNGACHAEYTLKIEKSTQIEYGNEKSSTRLSTAGNSESISEAIAVRVNASFSFLGIQLGGSNNASKKYGSERSFEVTNDNGLTVSYSTSTTNTVGVEEKITCDGVQNEKIIIQSRTDMIRSAGNVCVYLRYSETCKKHVFKCNYVDLKMYPVHNQNIVAELRCHREI